MQSKIAMLLLAALMTLSTMLGRCNAAPQPSSSLCETGLIEEMPSHIKKVCLALENCEELTKVLNAYLRSEAQGMSDFREDLQPLSAAKRKSDVDHVFLRFGKRR